MGHAIIILLGAVLGWLTDDGSEAKKEAAEWLMETYNE